MRGYPALVDEGAAVGVRVLETPAAQRAAMRQGTRRLLALNVPSPIRHVQGRLGNADQLALAAAPHGSPRAVLEDATVAALDALTAEAGGPAWDAAGFARLRAHVAGHLAERTAAAVADVVRILDAARDVRAAAGGRCAAPPRSRRRARTSSASSPGSSRPASSRATGVARLPDVERYLRAAARRLERLPDAPAPDLDKMRGVARAGGRARAPARGLARGPPRAGRAARRAVAAGGAAREPLRAGARHARPGLGEAHPQA